MTESLRVAVLGAGRWAQTANIPGWQRDQRYEIVVICDPTENRTRDLQTQDDSGVTVSK